MIRGQEMFFLVGDLACTTHALSSGTIVDLQRESNMTYFVLHNSIPQPEHITIHFAFVSRWLIADLLNESAPRLTFPNIVFNIGRAVDTCDSKTTLWK